MSRLTRIGFLVLLLAAFVSPQRASAQYQRTAGDLEGFRARLTVYMQQLQKLQPSRVPPEVIESIARLNSHELEILQNAFPSNERFWSTPTALSDFLEKSGAGVPTAAGPAFTETSLGMATSLSTQWRAETSGNPPTVNSFGLNDPKTIREGENFIFAYEVTAGSGTHLKQLVLWRALDRDGAPDVPTWTSVGYYNIDGNQDHRIGTLLYTPQASGIYWWGLHVIDQDGGEANENSDPAHQMTVKGVVQFDPTKKCPTGFNYEALWLSRDAETVCEIAKELIPEDLTTTIPYTIAAVAWSVSKGLRFSVEQVYGRWQDCENDKTFTKIDDTITSRASQSTANDIGSTADKIWTRLQSMDLGNLDVKLSSRADQQTARDTWLKVSDTGAKGVSDKATTDNIWGKVEFLDSRGVASQTTLENVWGKVANIGTEGVADKSTLNNIWFKVANVDTKGVSDKTTTDNIWGKVQTIADLNNGNLDAKISSRASEASLGTVSSELKSAIGAVGTGVNNANTGLGLAIGGVQATVNTKASQASVDTKASQASVDTKASQASVDDVANTLRIQERLDLQVIMIEPSRRYLVEVTKRGAPAAGLTVQQLQAFTIDKTGILIGLTPTFTTKEVAPGILDVTFAIPSQTKIEAFSIVLNHGQGTSALNGSTLWLGH